MHFKSKCVQQQPTVDDLVMLESGQIKAIKRAIRLHKQLNFIDFKHKNYNLQEILDFQFKTSLSSILCDFDRWLPLKKTQKHVNFKIYNETQTQGVKIKSLNFNLEMIEKSTFYAVSLHEMKLYV